MTVAKLTDTCHRFDITELTVTEMVCHRFDWHPLVLLWISKSCKRTDSDGFFLKSADPDADSDG